MKIVTFCAVGILSAIGMAMMTGCHKSEKIKPTVAPPVKVMIEVVGKQGNDVTERKYSATVQSSSSSDVSFAVAGTISALNVEEGQKVTKGQILGRVKAGDYENARNIAEAELAEARDAYQRMKKLHDADALPDIKWVEMQQKLKQAENAAEMATRTLSDATLRSPVTGVVSRKYASVGQNVIPGEPVYEILADGQLTADISVTENEIGSFSEGMEAAVVFENPEIGTIHGKVIRKSVVADPLTRAFFVKIAIPSENGKIMPGMVASVSFSQSEAKSTDSSGVYVLPQGSVLLSADNRNFVWLVKDGKAERKFVTANELSDNGIIVTSGLVPGDSVIVQGTEKVSTGSSVVAVN